MTEKANSFPFGNGPFVRSLCQSAGFLVRHTMCMSPRNPLISLSLPKIAYFRIGNALVSIIGFRMGTNSLNEG
jgi:hypothetical protein